MNKTNSPQIRLLLSVTSEKRIARCQVGDVSADDNRVQAPEYLRNMIRIVTETGLRIYKELTPMKKNQVDLYATRLSAGGVADDRVTNCFVRGMLTFSRSTRK